MKWLLCCCSESTNKVPKYWELAKAIAKKNKSHTLVFWNSRARIVQFNEFTVTKGSGPAKPQSFAPMLNKFDTLIIITDGTVEMKDIVMFDSMLDGIPFQRVTIYFIHNQSYVNHLFAVPLISNTIYTIYDNEKQILKGLSIKGLTKVQRDWIMSELNLYTSHQHDQIDAPLCKLIACVLNEGERFENKDNEWSESFCVELKRLQTQLIDPPNQHEIRERVGTFCNNLRDICDRFDSAYNQNLMKSKKNPGDAPVDWQRDPYIITTYKHSISKIDQIFQNIGHHYSLADVFMARASDHHNSTVIKRGIFSCISNS